MKFEVLLRRLADMVAVDLVIAAYLLVLSAYALATLYPLLLFVAGIGGRHDMPVTRLSLLASGVASVFALAVWTALVVELATPLEPVGAAFGASVGLFLGLHVVIGWLWYHRWNDWLATDDIMSRFTGDLRTSIAIVHGMRAAASTGVLVALVAGGVWAGVDDHLEHEADPSIVMFAVPLTGLTLIAAQTIGRQIGPRSWVLSSFRTLQRKLERTDVDVTPERAAQSLLALYSFRDPVADLRWRSFLRAADLRLNRLARRQPIPYRAAFVEEAQRLIERLSIAEHQTWTRPAVFPEVISACVHGELSVDTANVKHKLGTWQTDLVSWKTWAILGTIMIPGVLRLLTALPAWLE